MELKVNNIETKQQLDQAQKEYKLLLRNDGTLWTIVYVVGFKDLSFEIMVQSVNDLHRIANNLNDFAKEFKIVESINLFNVSTYDVNFDSRARVYMKENNKNNTETNLMVNETKMENPIQLMIQEHKELVARIEKLHAWVYGDAYKTVHPSEFANECIQLKAMKIYEEALRARLFNAGIKVAGTEYLVAIDSMTEESEDGDTTNND